MTDWARESAADAMSNRAKIDFGTSGRLHDVTWGTEEMYWEENHRSRPYVKADRGFDHYRPAYRYGTESAVRYRGKSWDEMERELEQGWNAERGDSGSTWSDIKDAVRDAWDRVTGHGRDDAR